MMEPISIWPYIISCAVLCIPGILMIVTGLLETRRLNAREKRRDRKAGL